MRAIDCCKRSGCGGRRGRRGFTLAEMIAAIALLAVFSVIVVQLFAASHRLAQRTDNLDNAVLCARNIAEAWKAGMDAAPATGAGVPANPLAGLRFGSPPGDEARQGFDASLQPVSAGSERAVYVANLSMIKDEEGVETLIINILAKDGTLLFNLGAARLSGKGVAP